MKTRILPQFLMLMTFVICEVKPAFSQNLAPNPSFETYTVCPETYGNGGPLECAPWQNGNLATSDFFHTCAVGTDVWVPDNLQGSQAAHTGNGYTGFFTRESSIWREYVQAPLLSPCLAGVTYHVSFYVSLADNFCATANIGAYLSATPPGPTNNIGTLAADPQIESNLGFINNNQDWVLITGCFVAEGGEQWITIGNFYNNANTPMEPGCSTSYASYYYLDDVSVVAGEPGGVLELELEDDVTTCAASYTIESDVTGVDYHWSTGATTPSITVSQSDVYVLTITSGCSSAIDSVEITFETSPQVQLGPATLILCEGESFNVSLDPALGEYTWQDGSHSPVYTVTTSGLYQVTLENACGISTDQIEITYNDSPALFTLGDDVAICNGETISYSLDPTLGNFLWQDGSISPSYTITAPGLYSLTISNDCGSVSDQILVSLSIGPVVELGPSTINFCENETINLNYNFNPDAGEYVWQDGSTSSSFVITAAGNYSVTVTNECGTTQDEILITSSPAPELISLGQDTMICAGEVISYSFDPALGMFEWQDGSGQANYVIQSEGIYHLTISNDCGAVADTIFVEVSEPPIIDLGPDISLCEGNILVIDLDPTLGNYTWQDGSNTPSYSISQAGTYAVTVSNACGMHSDAVDATVVSSIELDLGPDIAICPSQLPVTLDASSAHATGYVWQDNSTSPYYPVTGSGVYSVTVSNACFSLSDQVAVTIEDVAPQVMLPADVTLCVGDSLVLSASNAFGNYLWQDQSSDANFTVTQAGTYSLLVTNDCGSASDTIHVDYLDALLPPDLGPDLILCPGSETVLHLEAPNAQITWQDGSHADSIIVNAAGVYTVHVSNGCKSFTDTLLVSIDDNPPQLQLPDSVALCEGSIIELDAGIGGVSYLLSNGATSPSIEVNNPGIYILVVTSDCGSATDSIEVVSGGSIFSNVLPDTVSICEGESAMLSPDQQTALAYQWHDGITTPAHVVTNPGWYILQMTYSCGVVLDSTYVDVLSSVEPFSLGSDTILCVATSIILTVESGSNEIRWQNGSSSHQFLVASPGAYFVSVSNQCSSYSDTINILSAEAPALDLGLDQSLCPGEIIVLEPNMVDVSFLWSDGSTSSTYTVTTPGTISLVVENECGLDNDTIEISLDSNGPQIELGDTLQFCPGQIAILQGNVLGVDYLWQDGSTYSDLQVTIPGDYSVTVSNACGAGSDTVYVDFSKSIPAPQLGADTILCEGNSLSLFSSAEKDVIVMWQDGSTANSFEVMEPGIYVITESNMCGSTSDTIVVLYQSAPMSFDLGPDTTLCPDEFIMLTGPVNNDELTWNDGTHDQSIIADREQVYWLEVKNQCGVKRDEVLITIDQNVPSVNLPSEIIWCPEELITLDASQIFDASYVWSTGSNDPVIEANQPGIYIVNIKSLCGTSEAKVEIMEDENCNDKTVVYLPNIFSPNADGLNDLFYLSSSSEITSLEAHIFDRWGNEVFGSKEIEFKWDGTFHGKVLSPGVYTYMITIEFKDQGKDQSHHIAGDVTLML